MAQAPAIDMDVLDGWIERIHGWVGMAVETGAKIVGVVNGQDGNTYYELDDGTYIPTSDLVKENDSSDNTMLLILGLAFLLLSKKG